MSLNFYNKLKKTSNTYKSAQIDVDSEIVKDSESTILCGSVAPSKEVDQDKAVKPGLYTPVEGKYYDVLKNYVHTSNVENVPDGDILFSKHDTGAGFELMTRINRNYLDYSRNGNIFTDERRLNELVNFGGSNDEPFVKVSDEFLTEDRITSKVNLMFDTDNGQSIKNHVINYNKISFISVINHILNIMSASVSDRDLQYTSFTFLHGLLKSELNIIKKYLTYRLNSINNQKNRTILFPYYIDDFLSLYDSILNKTLVFDDYWRSHLHDDISTIRSKYRHYVTDIQLLLFKHATYKIFDANIIKYIYIDNCNGNRRFCEFFDRIIIEDEDSRDGSAENNEIYLDYRTKLSTDMHHIPVIQINNLREQQNVIIDLSNLDKYMDYVIVKVVNPSYVTNAIFYKLSVNGIYYLHNSTISNGFEHDVNSSHIRFNPKLFRFDSNYIYPSYDTLNDAKTADTSAEKASANGGSGTSGGSSVDDSKYQELSNKYNDLNNRVEKLEAILSERATAEINVNK